VGHQNFALPDSRLQSSSLRNIDLLLTGRIGLSSKTTDAVMKEVGGILSELGARAVWHRAELGEPQYVPKGRIHIVLSPERPEDSGHDRSTMGIAFASPRSGLATGGLAVVFPYKIAEVVSPTPKSRNLTFAVTRGPFFSQALGRVIAHEIIHVTIPDHPHSSGGVMNATQNRRTFTELEPVLDDAYARAFRAALQRFHLQPLSEVATAAAIGHREGETMRLGSELPTHLPGPPPF